MDGWMVMTGAVAMWMDAGRHACMHAGMVPPMMLTMAKALSVLLEASFPDQRQRQFF
jgi:hypothetical protein